VNPTKRKAKWNQGKKGGKSIEAKTMNDTSKKSEETNEAGRKYHRTIYYYMWTLIQIENQFSSYFQFYSFARVFVCALHLSFFEKLEITAHTEFLHNANNITRNKKDGGKKQEEIFLCWNFLSLIRRALYVNCVNFCLFNFLIFCCEFENEKFSRFISLLSSTFPLLFTPHSTFNCTGWGWG
jgi:hypothetical protein